MRSALGMDLSLALTAQPHLEDGVTYRPLRPTRRGIQVSRTSTAGPPETGRERSGRAGNRVLHPSGFAATVSGLLTQGSCRVVEAFGQLFRGANLESIVSEDEEDLDSVFRARSELMG